jgi:lipopolysaccharide cholinephosphotransferase
MTNNNKINSKVHDKIYKLLDLFNKESNKITLDYMLDSGTLLGAVRHKTIIPWDDDGDLIVKNSKENIKKLKIIFNNLKKYNIGAYKMQFGYKIFFNDGDLIPENLWLTHIRKFKVKNPNVKGRANISKQAAKTYKKSITKGKHYYKYKYPFVDIALYKIKNNRTYFIDNKWENCYHNLDDIKPYKKYTLKNIKLKGPNKYNTYLNSCYKNWKTQGLISYSHKNEKILKKKIIKLNLK